VDGRRDRALGGLLGLAVGDALGMPTQTLPRAVVAALYGDGPDGFRPGPPENEISAGLPAGHVTDVPGLSRNAMLKALGNVKPRHLLDQRLNPSGELRDSVALRLEDETPPQTLIQIRH